MFSVPFPKEDAFGTCVSSNQVQMSGTSKVVECTICRKSFACLRYVVKHMARVHSKEKEDKKPLECSICSKSFPRLSHLQRHQLIHIKDREWGCPFCEQSFVQKAHLMRHIGRWHVSQYRDGLEERIAANKWRSKDSEQSSKSIAEMTFVERVEIEAEKIPKIIISRAASRCM
nr:Zinc finger domain containing protein [Haemonchus contortus]